MTFILNSVESHNTIQNTSLLVARAYLTSSDGCSDRSYFVRSLKAEVQQNKSLQTIHCLNQRLWNNTISHYSSNTSVSSSIIIIIIGRAAYTAQPTLCASVSQIQIPFKSISTIAEHPSHPGSPIHPFGIDTLASLDFKTSHHPHPLSHEAPNSTDPADADHYPDNKRSVWTDITHRVLQLPLPSAPTASLFGSQTTAADIATGEDGSRGVFFFFSDIGIRVPGQFKLRIVISRMPQENCPHSLMNDQTHCTICKHSTQLAEVTTDIFISYPADTWEGHCSQTPLSNHFSRQGIHIPTSKTNNKNILKLYKKI
ncbi:hypothetical protein BASA61_004676 [Batrachochytrium salamandrivorans]|nr:hypothetical protein BASA61_004676 [Batrachochytrium salamandrivorans]